MILFRTNPPFWRYIPWKHVGVSLVSIPPFCCPKISKTWIFVYFWGDVQSTLGWKNHQIQARNIMYMYLGGFTVSHSHPFFLHHKLQEKSEWVFPKNVLNRCFPFIFGYFWYCFGWMCTCVPRWKCWAEATPEAQETPSGAVQEGSSIPVFEVQVSVDMFQEFLPVFVRSKKGAFSWRVLLQFAPNMWEFMSFVVILEFESVRITAKLREDWNWHLKRLQFAPWKWMDGRLLYSFLFWDGVTWQVRAVSFSMLYFLGFKLVSTQNPKQIQVMIRHWNLHVFRRLPWTRQDFIGN